MIGNVIQQFGCCNVLDAHFFIWIFESDIILPVYGSSSVNAILTLSSRIISPPVISCDSVSMRIRTVGLIVLLTDGSSNSLESNNNNNSILVVSMHSYIFQNLPNFFLSFFCFFYNKKDKKKKQKKKKKKTKVYLNRKAKEIKKKKSGNQERIVRKLITVDLSGLGAGRGSA